MASKEDNNYELIIYRLDQLEKTVEELKKKDDKLNDSLSGRDSKKLALWVGAFITIATATVIKVIEILISNLGKGGQ